MLDGNFGNQVRGHSDDDHGNQVDNLPGCDHGNQLSCLPDIDHGNQVGCLPDSLWLQIFTHLSQEDLCLGVRQCCHHWHDLSYDLTLWTDLDLSQKVNSITDHIFTQILSKIKHAVRRINISDCTQLTDTGILHQDHFCQNLKKVNISGTKISLYGFEELLKKYSDLEAVVCYNCLQLRYSESVLAELTHLKEWHHPISVGPTEQIMDPHRRKHRILDSRSLPHLEAVHIHESTIQDSELVQLSASCHNLKLLSLPGSCYIGDDGIAPSVPHWSSMTTLNLSQTVIKDSSLSLIAHNCPLLTSICLSGCSRVTDVGIEKLVRHCPTLKTLIVNQQETGTIGNITDVGLAAVGCHGGSLREISLFSCPSITDIGIQNLVEGCRGLATINVSACYGLTDDAMISIAENCTGLVNLYATECVHISRKGVKEVATKCSKLKILELQACHYLKGLRFNTLDQRNGGATSKETARTFSHDDNTKNNVNEDITFVQKDTGNIFDNKEQELQNIQSAGDVITEKTKGNNAMSSDSDIIDGSDTLTTDHNIFIAKDVHSDPSFSKQSMTLFSLKVLDLSFCSKIADDSVKAVARCCPKLEFLSLRGCYLVSNKAVAKVAQLCPNLRHLDTAGGSTFQASKISDEAMISLGEFAKSLEVLYVDKLPLLTLEGVRRVISGCNTLCRLAVTVNPNGPIRLVDVERLVKEKRRKCWISDIPAMLVISNTMRGDFHLKFLPIRGQETSCDIDLD